MIEVGEVPAVPIEMDYGISCIDGGVLVYRWHNVVYKDEDTGEEEYEPKCEIHVFMSMPTALAYIQSIDDSVNHKQTEADNEHGVLPIEGTER